MELDLNEDFVNMGTLKIDMEKFQEKYQLIFGRNCCYRFFLLASIDKGLRLENT